MRPNIAERSFEDAIVSVLVSGRPGGTSGGRAGEPWPGYGEFIPGGYRLGKSEEYDRSLCVWSRATKRSITGLIVTPEGEVSIGRDRKRLVRSMVHRYKQYTRGERDFGKDRRKHLSGLLAFILDVEPDFYNRLVLKYGAETVNAALHARRRSR